MEPHNRHPLLTLRREEIRTVNKGGPKETQKRAQKRALLVLDGFSEIETILLE
jgi:hypothetical protein